MCPTGCSSAGRSPCSSICGARTGPTPTLSGSPTARAGSRTGSSPTRWWRAWGRRRVTPWPWAQACLGAATRYALAVGAGGRERAHRLAALLRQLLAEIPGVRVLDRGRQRCAIVSLDVAGRDAADLKLRLRQRGINASSADRMSGVLDMDDKGARSVLRFSPHYYNTEDELDAAVGTLAELARS